MNLSISNHIDKLSLLSTKELKNLLRCTDKSDINKKNIIIKLILENYFAKPKLKNINKIQFIGGVLPSEYNVEEIHKNNSNIKNNFPWNEGKNLDKIKNLLNERYDSLKNSLTELLTINTKDNDTINIDFINNFYKNFYIGNYNNDNDNICSIMNNFVENDGENSSIHNDLIKKKSIGKGAAGIAFLIESKFGDYEIVIKKINKVKQYRNKFLSLDVMLWKYDYPLKKDLENRYHEFLLNNIFNTYEARYSNYCSYNAFISDNNNGLVFLSSPNDNFTNQTILHIILNQILTFYNNNNFIYQFDAFFCENRSITKRNFSSLGKLITLGHLDRTNVIQVDGYNIIEYANI